MNEYLFSFIHILSNIYFKVNSIITNEFYGNKPKKNFLLYKLSKSFKELLNLYITRKNRVTEKSILYNSIFLFTFSKILYFILSYIIHIIQFLILIICCVKFTMSPIHLYFSIFNEYSIEFK